MNKNKNHLSNSKSPYLLQHKDNPVHWFPWSDEAFEKAINENKPIFLSIGYSTCHWCHVMAHESFEDQEVADLLNKDYISIKVDREERPDIDNIYMQVTQIMTGSGGWPLTIIMTPEKKPFYSATYIPKNSKYGRIGLIELLPQVAKMWKEQRTKINNSANEITSIIQYENNKQQTENIDNNIFNNCFNYLENDYDKINGGFGKKPKFPNPLNLLYLIKYYKLKGNKQAFEIVENTLIKMREGGIYDHLGYGFHRYSTDREWLVPHFEKMLYDQALLARAYINAYQVNNRDIYKQTSQEIFNYVLRDMTSQEGAFYTAEDADSEGVEGKYYIWESIELDKVLNEQESNIIQDVYNVSEKGNYQDELTGQYTGKNIFHIKESQKQIADKYKLTVEKLDEIISISNNKLYQYRKKRISPHKDDKILTDWNGIMIASLAYGSRVFKNQDYLNAAKKACDFIEKNMFKNNTLLHRYRLGDSSIDGNLTDYSFFVWALLELYQTTFETKYLALSIEMTNLMVEKFYNEKIGAFYFAEKNKKDLIANSIDYYDSALPSGNSIAFANLINLYKITSNIKWEKLYLKLLNSAASQINNYPHAHTMLLNNYLIVQNPSYEIVIVGNKNDTNTISMINSLKQYYLPGKVIVFKDMEEDDSNLKKYIPFINDYVMINNKVTVYVCKNFTCKFPTNNIETVFKLLEE